MPAFVDTTVKDIDARLRELQDEVSRLEAARSALTGGRRRSGRPRGATPSTTGASARTTRARTGRRTSTRRPVRPSRRGGNTRANQTLELVREKPGITIPEIAKAMKIEPNYLYRVLPRLESNGQVKRDGQGWHPAAASTSLPRPCEPLPRANGHAPRSPSRRHRQPGRRRLGKPPPRIRQPTAGPLRARPRRRCSPRSPVVRL